MIILRGTDSDNEDFRLLIGELDKELWSRYDNRQSIYDKHNIIENNKNVVVAYKNEIAVGCGCFKKFNDRTVEIKSGPNIVDKK